MPAADLLRITPGKKVGQNWFGLLFQFIIFTTFIAAGSLACAQEQDAKAKRILLFPFRVDAPDLSKNTGSDLAGVLRAELAQAGDNDVSIADVLKSIVLEKKVDVARIERIMTRSDVATAIWGALAKTDGAYSLEIQVLERGKGPKPRTVTVTGKDVEEIIGQTKEVVEQIQDPSAAGRKLKVGDIKIEGNKRVQKDAILNKMDLKPGSPFKKGGLGDEIRELYSMGFFDDVKIEADETGSGAVDLKITLKERPFIKEIEVEGNSVISKDNILDALTAKSNEVASTDNIHNDIEKMKKMYEKQGYFQPKIEYELKELSPNEAKLIFKINEGQKSYLTHIVLEGAKSLSENELKKVLSIKEKDWIWFLDESGTFTREKLDENRVRLMLYYMDHGFINVQVGTPNLEIKDRSAVVTFPIREGDRFQVRKVNVEGDLVIPADKLVSELQLKPKTWFKRSTVGDDIKALTRVYNNLGYAYADIEPKQQINEKNNFVDLTYKITKGDKVTIDRVEIAGNDRTRDKVIRRQLEIGEGDTYNADRLEVTKQKLEALDFFEAVKLKPTPGSRADQMNLTVEVLEKKTGSLAAGLGYSSQEGAMGNINLRERNLLGLGIVANVKSNISGRKNTYEGSLAYPWLFDIPLTVSVNGKRTQGKEQSYYRETDGFGIAVGFPLYGLWTFAGGVNRETNKLSGFEKGFARSITHYYKGQSGNQDKFVNSSENSLSLAFNRDTRDSANIPSSGSKITIGSRLSGFGGDVAFSNYFSEAAYYHRLFWKAIFKLKVNGTMLAEAPNEPIPFDRRILLGGIHSIRGYQGGEIGPKDIYGNIMGGDRAVYSNMEVFFPVLESMKLSGVVFMDAGNAWNASDSPLAKDLKAGYGAGIRWVSPMGPLRIEYGWKINPGKGEAPGAFGFAMGQLF